MHEITRLSRQQRGFTLTEMMLAIAIFALLALMAAQVLRSVLHTQQRFSEKTSEMARAQQAIRLLERDISQATIRPMADETRVNLADFSVTKGVSDEIELVQNHWANPGMLLARSSLERVRYRLNQGQLQRLSFPGPDATVAQARVVSLLQGVTRFQLRFAGEGVWQNAWSGSSVLPQAVEVTLELPGIGELRRIILSGRTY